jgi:FdhD protein
MRCLSPAKDEEMIANTKTVSVLRVTEHGTSNLDTPVAGEFPVTIVFDNNELVTLLCSPSDLEYLAVGFLFAEGFITSKNDIKKIAVDEQKGIVHIARAEGAEFPRDLLFKRLITSACGRGAAFYSTADAQNLTRVESPIVISVDQVFALMEEFNQRSSLYKATGGVHGAALADSSSILIWNDDLGRHNAIDKVFGECIMRDIPTENRIVITSGRTPSEMIVKVAKGRVPILISPGASTDLGVRLANDLGVTLIGFVRGKNMTVYTNEWRIAN